MGLNKDARTYCEAHFRGTRCMVAAYASQCGQSQFGFSTAFSYDNARLKVNVIES
jgi:hypothetical protein